MLQKNYHRKRIQKKMFNCINKMGTQFFECPFWMNKNYIFKMCNEFQSRHNEKNLHSHQIQMKAANQWKC